jgi:hypothetical protein
MNEQADIPKWSFDKVAPGTMERNPVSEEFFTNGTRLEAVIRESLQNSLDATDGGEGPVEVRIYFSGEDDKLPAEKMLRYFNGGEKRFSDPKNGLVVPSQTLSEPCRFLVIEDFHTTGLTGITDERPLEEDVTHRNDWNYYNYFFRENGSTKVGANTLGSWGAGKCVFQRASKLKCSFTYSVRDAYEPRAFVVGKATLKFHTDAEYVTWAPDGWFGLKVPTTNPRKMEKVPVTEADFIATFREDFNIKRIDEPGTSIAIPYINLSENSENEGALFNQRNLVRAVLRNFLVAIHEGKLKVVVQVGKSGTETVIDKSNVSAYGSFLPTPGDRDALVTTLHHDLILSTQNSSFPGSQKFSLASPGENPNWNRTMFNDEQLKSIRKLLHEKKPCEITIPMPIRAKSADGTVTVGNAKFKVIIKRHELPKALPPVFYRVGLLIDSVATTNLNNYIAAVLIDRDKLADLLVAAEPPSHSKWNYDTDRVAKEYDKPRSHIRYVSYAVREILNTIASFDQSVNWDPLSDVFGIKRQKSGDGNNNGNKPDDSNNGNDAGGDDQTQSEKLRIVAITEINGAEKGIRAKSGDGLEKVADDKFPFKAKFSVGYDTFRGLDWSPNDFDLGKGTGGVTVRRTEGTVEFDASGNQLVFTIKDKTPFCVTITGFDPNRDITAAKLRYEYRKEAENGVSV